MVSLPLSVDNSCSSMQLGPGLFLLFQATPAERCDAEKQDLRNGTVVVGRGGDGGWQTDQSACRM